MEMVNLRQLRQQGQLFICGCLCCLSCLCCLLTSCSEDDDAEDEYANWPTRNSEFFDTLEDSLAAQPAQWVKIKNWSLDPDTLTAATDYIYVKVIESGATDGPSPCYTDSVRIIYQGQLLPTKNSSEGEIFDTSVYGEYSMATAASVKFLVSGLTDGVATALQNMHRGDYWRVYVPYQLGYGTSSSSSVPAFSVLTFDLILLDFSPAGEPMAPWK